MTEKGMKNQITHFASDFDRIHCGNVRPDDMLSGSADMFDADLLDVMLMH